MKRIDDLDLPSTEKALLKSFVRSWSDHGGPVLFAGAGLSKNALRKANAPAGAAFLSWKELSAKLLDDLTGGDEPLKARLPTNDLRLAELHEAQLQRARLLDHIAQGVPSDYFDPGDAHRCIARIPWAGIVTTNYDDLIERSFERRRARRIVWDADLTRHRTRDDLLVIKMHGDLADLTSIIITEEDYRCYGVGRPGIITKVKQLLLEHPLLFVGFSLIDPNFSAIDGWIRDTVKKVKLPSVALMYGAVLPAERTLWQRRGIDLIAFDSDVGEVLGALEAEANAHAAAARRGVSGRVTENRPPNDDDIGDLVAHLPAGWKQRVVDAAGAESSDSIRIPVIFEMLRSMSEKDIASFLAALGERGRQVFLERIYLRGISMIHGTDGVKLDIAGELFRESSLPAANRLAILLRRIETSLASNDLELAASDLREASEIADTRDARERLDKLARAVAWQRDDTTEIARHLMEPIVEGNAFAYCRRGSDALAIVHLDQARKLYQQGLEVARTGDEETSALFGLMACEGYQDSARVSDLNDKCREIAAAERPRTEQIESDRDCACRDLLRGEPDVAAQQLERAILRAEEMGWPRAWHLSRPTLLDQLTEDLLRLRLRTDATSDQIKEGITTIAKAGPALEPDVLTEELTDRFLASPGAIPWVRSLLSSSPLSPNLRLRAKDLLSSAFLVVLSDDEIEKHIHRVLLVPLSESPHEKGVLGPEFTRHYELLARSFWCVPKPVAGLIVDRVLERFSDRWLWRHTRNFDLPWQFWAKSGVLSLSRLDTLVASLSERIAVESVISQWPERRALLGIIQDLQASGCLSSAHQALLVAAAETAVQHILRAEGRDIGSTLIDYVSTLAGLREWLPSKALAEKISNLYSEVRNSTMAGAWAEALGPVMQSLTSDARAQLVANVVAYCQLAVESKRGDFVYRPAWAARMISEIVSVAPELLPASEATTLLQGLVERDPAIAPLVAASYAVLAPEDLSALEDRVLSSWMSDVSQRDLVFSWALQGRQALSISTAVSSRLVSYLTDHDAWVRSRSYSVLDILAVAGKISEDAAEAAVSAALSFGLRDPHWIVRCAAARTVGRAKDATCAVYRLQELLADPIAGVRRAAEESLHSVQQRTSGK